MTLLERNAVLQETIRRLEHELTAARTDRDRWARRIKKLEEQLARVREVAA